MTLFRSGPGKEASGWNGDSRHTTVVVARTRQCVAIAEAEKNAAERVLEPLNALTVNKLASKTVSRSRATSPLRVCLCMNAQVACRVREHLTLYNILCVLTTPKVPNKTGIDVMRVTTDQDAAWKVGSRERRTSKEMRETAFESVVGIYK